MKEMKITLTALFALLISTSFAQKIKLVEGDIAKLAGQKSINIEFDWDQISVGKFDQEADYLKKKVEEYNADEPGRGDKWKEAWQSDKASRFEPKFIELFNKYAEKSGLSLVQQGDSKYTMIVKTTFIEPGFNVFVTKRPASVDVEISIVETANKSNVVAKITSKGNAGQTFGYGDLDTGIRITESYAVAGKYFGKYVAKQLK